MIIYYCVTIITNVVAAIVFYRSINITGLSVMPLFLIALMIFQALIFKNEKSENEVRTAYGSSLTAGEENKMLGSISSSLFATIPWMIPFVVFFSSPIKFLSILVYIISILGGAILYRLQNKSKISNRIKFEEEQRREQETREQLGKYK